VLALAAGNDGGDHMLSSSHSGLVDGKWFDQATIQTCVSCHCPTAVGACVKDGHVCRVGRCAGWTCVQASSRAVHGSLTTRVM
jgi:hypothetical protein